MENLTSKQKTILIIVGIIVVGIFMIYMSSRVNSYSESNLDNIENEIEEQQAASKTIKIHITGAVKKEGVIELEEGARIQDAIDEVGGLTEQADISNVNLAYILQDSQKIYIPKITDDEEQIINIENGEEIIVDSGFKSEEKNNNKINLNTATRAQLETLSGIGTETAEKIIEYRKNNGKFKSIEDIKNVSGIGEAKFQSIKEYISVE